MPDDVSDSLPSHRTQRPPRGTEPGLMMRCPSRRRTLWPLPCCSNARSAATGAERAPPTRIPRLILIARLPLDTGNQRLRIGRDAPRRSLTPGVAITTDRTVTGSQAGARLKGNSLKAPRRVSCGLSSCLCSERRNARATDWPAKCQVTWRLDSAQLQAKSKKASWSCRQGPLPLPRAKAPFL